MEQRDEAVESGDDEERSALELERTAVTKAATKKAAAAERHELVNQKREEGKARQAATAAAQSVLFKSHREC